MGKRLVRPKYKDETVSRWEAKKAKFLHDKQAKVDKRQKDTYEKVKKGVEEKKKLVVPEVDTYMIERKAMLPRECRMRFGCVECDWKKVRICPYKYTKKAEKHANGVCHEKSMYLASFIRDGNEDKRLTFSKWHKDFLVGKAASKENLLFLEMEQLQNTIDEMKEDKAEPKEITLKENDLAKKHKMWQSLWRDVVTIEDRQVDRETPKKMEIEHTKRITPEQMHSIMREDAIDVKVKKVEGGGEDEN